jgi:hypothetical protein
MSTFVIPDCHGHFDRLEALLLQEQIIDGTNRINHDVTVVQLGDLGHFGESGSPTGDLLCYRAACNGWIDIVLWGNHDRALVDRTHAFKGFQKPNAETLSHVDTLRDEKRLVMAYEADGYLLTHAGLHSSFKHQKVHPDIKTDPAAFAKWINHNDVEYLNDEELNFDPQSVSVRDAISAKRGGYSQTGGILWRDSSESLFDGYPQVFGHSCGDSVRSYSDKHYCIDVGSQYNGRLVGVWLPTMDFTEVNLNDR